MKTNAVDNVQFKNVQFKNVQISNVHFKKLLTFLFFTIVVFILAAQGVHAVYSPRYFTAFTVPPDTDSKVKLDWSSVAGAQAYVLQREEAGNPGSATTVASITVDQVFNPLSYTDAGLKADMDYKYTIKAFTISDGTLATELDSLNVFVTTSAMIPPHNLKAVYDVNSRSAALTWNSSFHATDTRITHSDESGSIVDVWNTGTVSGAGITIRSRATQRFSLESLDSSSVASPSESVSVTPIDAPYITVSASGGAATISWFTYPQMSYDMIPYPHINQFQLQSSSWNVASGTWSSWVNINSTLAGQNITVIPPSGGDYRYRLAAKSDSAYTGFSNITESTSGLPAPANLSLAVTNTKHIALSWTNGAGNKANIQVLRKVGDGAFSQIAMLPSSSALYTDNSITVTAGTVYTYQVRSYESADSISSAAEASISLTLPVAPSTLQAHVVSSSAVTLNWTDRSDNESEFRIERMTNPGVFTQIGTVSSNITTYTDNTVSAGNSYIYRVRAHNALGDSAYSNEVTINAWDSVAPATLTVTAVSASRIDLVWSYAGTESYNTIIERKTGTDGTWSVIYTTALGTLRYSDTGLSPNTRYFYRIRKSLGTGALGISFPNDNIGKGAYTLLGNLTLTGRAASGNTIYLTWSGNTGIADVVIERKMSNGAFSALTTVSPSTTGWYDNTGLVPSASYTYRIKARTSINESVYSNEITVQNLFLEAPSGLSVSVSTNSAIELKWTDNSTDETGFEIWRYVYGTGTYTLYATVDKNVTTYTDTSIHTGVQYYYMVRAYVATGSLYSPYSNTASIGAGLINPPSNLYYTYISSSQVLLRWTDTSDNESGFKIEWKIGQDGEWNTYAWVTPNTTAYTVSNLNSFTKYYFRLRAYSSTGNADSLSGDILVSTAIPAAPSEVTATSLSASQIKLTWKDNSDSEAGFRIMRKPSNGYHFTPLAEVGKDITSFTDGSLVAGMTYYYKIVSYNATGSSESSQAEVKTNIKVTFSDLKSVASWAKDPIENLAGMGIVKGVEGSLFKPNNQISKAEFTAMVIRAFKINTVPVGSLADVKSNKWYYHEIMVAENFGIISGDSNRKFYPENAITREEIAVILFKALQASGKEYAGHDNSVLEKFSDKNTISPHAMASIAALVGEGIMEGMSGNALGPKYTATRAQAAVFLYRALNK